MSPSISLEELQKLSSNSPTKRTTSLSPQTENPSSQSLEKPNVSLVIPKKNISALAQFEDSVGGRQSIIDSLSLATLDRKEAHFLNLLQDPRRERDDINTIAKDAGLKPIQIIELFRNAAFAKAHAISMSKLSESLPAVVQDIADKSIDAEIKCPTCFGDGKDSNGESCMQCAGRGKIIRYSDLDRQKIVLEVAGVTKKGGGVNVNVQQNVGIMQPGSFFSRYVKDSDAVAYDVIDVEPEEKK